MKNTQFSSNTAQSGSGEHDIATLLQRWQDDSTLVLLADGVLHTSNNANDNTWQSGSSAPPPGNEVVDPAPEDGLLDAAELALQHPMEQNPHVTKLLRIAPDPAIACSVLLLLTYLAASVAELGPAARSQRTPGIDRGVHDSAPRNLATDDAKALDAVLYRIVCWAGGSLQPLTENELDLITRAPQALVRTAYVLGRELTVSDRQAA